MTHITFVQSDDRAEREQACFEMNLSDTSDCPRCQVLSSFITHVRRERKKERVEGKGMSPRENTRRPESGTRVSGKISNRTR